MKKKDKKERSVPIIDDSRCLLVAGLLICRGETIGLTDSLRELRQMERSCESVNLLIPVAGFAGRKFTVPLRDISYFFIEYKTRTNTHKM